ncbi:LexA family protein [Metapseudomonas otitidis]|uniref:LexA family protein n=1 Tax=Metapseudomonas otitidis TaxID=319939 RepID=UPI00366C5A59
MSTLGQRIAELRKKNGMSQRALAAACGWGSQSRVGNYETDSREPSLDDIERMAKALGVTSAQLIAGSPADQSNVQLAAQPTRYYRYPVLSWVSAGLWGDALQPYEPGAEDQHELSDYKGKAPCFWLKVSGDSMTAPIGDSIPDGHLILVDTGMEARPGHLVIAKLESEDKATFKRLVQDGGRMFLKPLNPAYPLIEINGTCRFIGVVVETKRKLV